MIDPTFAVAAAAGALATAMIVFAICNAWREVAAFRYKGMREIAGAISELARAIEKRQ